MKNYLSLLKDFSIYSIFGNTSFLNISTLRLFQLSLSKRNLPSATYISRTTITIEDDMALSAAVSPAIYVEVSFNRSDFI